MGQVIMTRTACELFYTPAFWKKRCAEQLKYIHEIETSHRTPDRKWELQLSALDIYRDCLDNIDAAQVLSKIMHKVNRRTTFAPEIGGFSMELHLPPFEYQDPGAG